MPGGREGWTTRKQRQRNNKRRETRTANMLPMFVTELVSQSPMGWLNSLASYSATRDGWPCDVRVDARKEGGRDDEETTTAKQQAARNTYSEHVTHVRHRARVPVTDGLVEFPGILQCNEGRMAV
jgi:hypothetical protein